MCLIGEFIDVINYAFINCTVLFYPIYSRILDINRMQWNINRIKSKIPKLFSLKIAVAQAYFSLNVTVRTRNFFYINSHSFFFSQFETIYIHFSMNFTGWVSVKMMLLLKKFRKGY